MVKLMVVVALVMKMLVAIILENVFTFLKQRWICNTMNPERLPISFFCFGLSNNIYSIDRVHIICAKGKRKVNKICQALP